MKSALELGERETRAAMAEARQLLASITPEAAVRRPRPDAWSAAECLEHLTITADEFLPLLDEAIARRAAGSVGDYRPGWLGRWFLRQIEPAEKQRSFRAPSKFVPAPSEKTGEQALEAFLAAHERLLVRLPQLEPLDLARVRVNSPFATWMSYPVGLVCYLIPAHCRRHLRQARRATESA